MRDFWRDSTRDDRDDLFVDGFVDVEDDRSIHRADVDVNRRLHRHRRQAPDSSHVPDAEDGRGASDDVKRSHGIVDAISKLSACLIFYRNLL